MNKQSNISIKKPRWLRRKLPSGAEYERINRLIRRGKLNTVCQEAQCPNQFECFSQQTATFLILGSKCTRNCGFCNIEMGSGAPVDPDEPQRVAMTAQQMKLRYVVVTSVTRDDLTDGGASMFARTIREIKTKITDVRVEVLIPDFKGDFDALKTVLNAKPDVLNHNIETVPRLYKTVRPQAVYSRSLTLLRRVALVNSSIPVKSGLMLGLGEVESEIQQTLEDLFDANCRMLTLGQYLQPSKKHLPVVRFVAPKEFDMWKEIALKIGFTHVFSGPFVRSSYHAKSLYKA